MNSRYPLSQLLTEGLIVVMIITSFVYFPSNILSWDVFGYYLYLPATFIYHDLGLTHTWVNQIINEYHSTATLYQALQMPSGYWVLKYPSGLALMYAPFFIIGHLLALIFGFPADGFSQPYQYSMMTGCLIVSYIGLLLLRKCLVSFFSEKISALLLVIIVIGTNYLFHTATYGQGAMSHNYIFTLYAGILWLTICWHKTHRSRHIIMLAIACGLAVISRPSEVVCLLIPAFWGISNRHTLIAKIRILIAYRIQVLLFCFIVISIISVQLIYWKLFAGHFLFNSYGGNAGEGLDLNNPHILQVLFSYRKGWLLYTPLMGLGLVGFFALFKKQKNVFLSVLLFFIFNLWIVSSWSCWWYAESFSQRALIPSYVFLALPLGYCLNYIIEKRNLFRYGLLLFIGLFVCLNLFQSWQALNGILHLSRMTGPYYRAVFGKTSIPEGAEHLLLVNRSFTEEEKLPDEKELKHKTPAGIDFENLDEEGVMCDDHSHSGACYFKLDKEIIYSPTIENKYSEITKEYYAWIRPSVYVYAEADKRVPPSSLVICFMHNEYPYKYRQVALEEREYHEGWNKVSLDYLTPEVRSKSDAMRVYVWNRSEENLMIDDLKVEIFEPYNNQ